ncbi:AAA family ATPase [Humibacillus sp. DSM 29435]|nr:AAA family ATPase [Humibacillus sp. DSM 29435]
MFDLMAPPVDAFLVETIAPGIEPGQSWTSLVAAVDAGKGIIGKQYDALDPQVQLRMLTENIPHKLKPGWYPFSARLGRAQQGFANELRDTRNDWAHNRSFTDDDAYRALDTAERFLTVIGAPEAAAAVEKIRLDLRRVSAAKQDRRSVKDDVDNPSSPGVKPWREVLRPHDDVAMGNFQAAEFAADLYKVAVSKDAPKDYADPVEFFSRTYLTAGLRDLLTGAVRRLSGDDNASPVINLQTNFGGGKTHSMLALWHLASGCPLGDLPQELQDLLSGGGYDTLPAKVGQVAIVGNHTATSGFDHGATHINTLWGELAWQLGGDEGYALVAKADHDRTPPGQALHALLAAYAPAVILIDEWVAYARSLLGREDLAGGTFDDQFTFAQSLTEAAKGTSGILLAISIPASESGDDSRIVAGNAEEVGGSNGLEALKRLQNVVRRVADQWRPASSDEAYHIVRQRLFTTPDAAALAAIGATSKAFVEYYRKHSADFPREARDTAYEERIKQTYPIHPELFDRLYEDWSTLERFQRTRGVLRLMNKIIHALWVGEDQSPLIMPASIPLAESSVNSEITGYLEDRWKAIIDADVDGANSEPAKIDKDKPLFGQRSLTKRLARTVFFGAAPTIGSAHKGLESQRVFLGTAVPGDVPGNFHSALAQLGDKATYFYSGSGKYWYDLQANISRRAKDQADRLHPEDVWAEIVRRLAVQGRTRGDFAGVHVCPEDNGDLPDTDEARLVILHPKTSHKRNSPDSTAMVFAQRATENRGAANRANRNMLVFLAADEDRLSELDSVVREYLGWSDVLAKQDELDLTQNQKNQAIDKQKQANETAQARLLGTYQWALVPDGQPVVIKATKVEGQAPALAERVSKRLGNDGALTTQQAAAAIRLQLDTTAKSLWESGHVAVGDLWKLYAAYAYMPRLRDRSVLNEGLLNAPLLWERDGFALADSYEKQADGTSRYRGLVLPREDFLSGIRDSTLIVKPPVALEQRRKEQPEIPNDPNVPVISPAPDTPPRPEPGPTPKPRKTRFFGTKELSADAYAKDFKKITDEILSHLAGTPGATLRVTLEIEATQASGFDESKVRTVSENAKTLKFDQSGFEDA